MAYSRRAYKGAAVANSLGSGLIANATTITLTNVMSGWSTSGTPFFVVVDPGTAKEEKICVIYASSTTLTVVDPAVTSSWTASVNGRGADDTTDRAHDTGAVIYPVFTATEANQANEIVSKYTTNGDLVVHGSTGLKTISTGGSGNNNKVLVADSTVSDGGVKWATVGTDSIADSAITSGKIADGAIVNADINASAAIALSKLATGALPTSITVASANLVNGTIVAEDIADDAITTGKILDSNVTLAKLASAVANALVPVGTITAYAGATAPTGWLLCDGTSTTGYTALAALVGATTPDFRGRFLIGDNASLTLLGTGGSTTIGTNNLPAHTHAAGTLGTAAAAAGVSITDDGAEQHTHFLATDLLTSTTSHGHGQDGQLMGGTSATPAGTGSYTVGVDGDHTHNITDPTHSHTVTGSTASTGGAEAYYQPYGVVSYIIKHD
jgi:microcystin-dependent protein